FPPLFALRKPKKLDRDRCIGDFLHARRDFSLTTSASVDTHKLSGQDFSVNPLRKALSRVTRMSWDEVQVRARQEIGKRADFVRWSTGFPSRAHLKTVAEKAQPRFFFSPADLPDRVRLLKQHLPDQVEQTIIAAEEICVHRLRLLGYDALDYGSTIDWHL